MTYYKVEFTFNQTVWADDRDDAYEKACERLGECSSSDADSSSIEELDEEE